MHAQTTARSDRMRKKGQVRLPYSTRALHTMKARKATWGPCQRSVSYEGLRAYDAVFFLQKRTSQVPGAMQVRATRLQHGSATALCTLLAKGARPQLPVKKETSGGDRQARLASPVGPRALNACTCLCPWRHGLPRPPLLGLRVRRACGCHGSSLCNKLHGSYCRTSVSGLCPCHSTTTRRRCT